MLKADSWRRRWAKRSAKVRVRPHSIPWGSVLWVTLLLIVLPTAAYAALAHRYPGFILVLHYYITLIYLLTSLMLLAEAWAAFRAGRSTATTVETPLLPLCTAIIAAYLPNEQDLILQTVQHLLTQVDVPPEKLQLILAYNTPESLAVEADLQEISARDSRLLLLRVSGSRSKAENVNAALGAATGEIVAIYDADHQPAADCFRRAWGWISGGCDMVQGRCLIRNQQQNWFTRTIAIEFDTIYAVSHPGRAHLSRMAIFGGSNGYWRREVLSALQLDPAMLTEDIDISLRALLEGRRLVHDRALLSAELAPLQVGHWMLQRKRWAQGWLEVALKYTGPLMRSPHYTPVQKFLWFYLLAWREAYPALSIQFFPFVLAALLTRTPIHWFGSPFFLAAGIINLACGPLVLLTTFALAPPKTRQGLGAWYWVYGLGSLLYTTLKLAVTLVAQISHILRDREWVTTPRPRPDETNTTEDNYASTDLTHTGSN